VVFEGRWAGPPARVLGLAPALAERGVESVLVVPEAGSSWLPEVDTTHCRVIRVPVGRVRATPNPWVQARWLLSYRGDIARLRKVIREVGPDIVHTYGFMNAQAVFAARAESVPLVWHLNDLVTPRILRRGAPWVLGHFARAVAADGPEVAAAYHLDPEGLPGEGIVLFPSYDEARYNRRVTAPAGLRASWNWPTDALVIGTVGNVNPDKGYEYLVDAFIGAANQDDRLRLVVVGALLETREPYAAKLRARLRAAGMESRVQFLGLRLDAPEVMRAVDFYVQASVSETGPATVVEACALGLPVVATRVGAVMSMIEDGRTGIIVEPRDTSALVEGILRLAGDPELRRRLATAASESVEARFGSGAAADALSDFYASLLDD